jgi:uncharacterized membrane protein YraQ (UPF0718 family)
MTTTTKKRWRPGALEYLAGGLLLLLVAQRYLIDVFDVPSIQAGSTIFVAIMIQALPFLIFGVLISGAITAFVPASFWQRILPKNKALAVPVAGCAGLVLPGCECASVPVAGSLMNRGVAPSAALAFLLSAPAINPIVLISTFVAFQGEPQMVVARFLASLGAAIIMGWLWLKFGNNRWLKIPEREHLIGDTKWQTFRLTATHDFLHAGGFLVIGAMAAAALNVGIPGEWMRTIAENPVFAILGMAALAILLSICSEADAFIAASFTEFSLTAKLTFMVVGPMVDLKLISMQAGIFSKKFAARFAPTTAVVAIIMSVLVGWWLLT